MDGLEGDAAKAKGVEIAADVIEQLRFVTVISRRGRIGEVVWLEQAESVGPRERARSRPARTGPGQPRARVDNSSTFLGGARALRRGGGRNEAHGHVQGLCGRREFRIARPKPGASFASAKAAPCDTQIPDAMIIRARRRRVRANRGFDTASRMRLWCAGLGGDRPLGLEPS